MNTRVFWSWAPTVLLTLGAALTVGIDTQRALPLRADLGAVVPDTFGTFEATDQAIPDAELRVVGVDDYLYRIYERPDSLAEAAAPSFTVYVGYYEEQARGTTIHSPKNCLPGAGWEALTSATVPIATTDGDVVVNRYLIQREAERALVLYWYQGRGRVAANEYRVKLDLLMDAAFRNRSDEALVRIVVPVIDSERDALQLASEVASNLIVALDRALPT